MISSQHRNDHQKMTKASHTIWIIASVHKWVSSSTARCSRVRRMCIITSQFRILTTLLNAGLKSGGGGGGNARKHICKHINELTAHPEVERTNINFSGRKTGPLNKTMLKHNRVPKSTFIFGKTKYF